MKKIFISSSFLNIFLALASILLSISIIEITLRLIEYDFERQRSKFEAMPIYYRWPTVPIGEIFFRRHGPDVWQGKVLSTGLEGSGGLDKAYIDETEVTISYDKRGFRNPENLTDWDVVVVGDSFVELGYLPYEDLFTTHIGNLVEAKMKNLGVSYTGPLTYIFYLKQYGKSPNTKHAVMVFFEGNDIKDLLREEQALQTFKSKSSYRLLRHFAKQSSFLRASYRLLRHVVSGTPGKNEKLFQNAYFINSYTGEEVPVSVRYTPPSKDQLTAEQIARLEDAIFKWSEAAESLGITPWLVYMPAKRRVLDGYLRFTENAPQKVADWHPTDLPDLIQDISERYGIGFIDVTPALVRETSNGNLTYNPIWDTHLNRLGSFVVAQEIADELSKVK